MTSRGIDYYGVLGLTKGAKDAEIKEAYQHLSLQYNPIRNKNPDLQDLFTLVGEAYEVLNNPLLKAIYDQYGEAAMKKGILTPVGWHAPWLYHGQPLRTFKKFFGTDNPYADLMYCRRDQIAIFKAKRPEDQKEKDPPIERYLDLSLCELYFGTIKKIKIQRRVYNAELVKTELKEKILCIKIKPGLPSGTKIVFNNIGDEGPSKVPGDLIIVTRDLPHPRFRRKGVNLHMCVTLQLKQSMSGLVVELRTIDSRLIRFAITDVITTGYTKTIPNEGMPYVDDNDVKGDLIVIFAVDFPFYMSETARKKIMEALSEEPFDNPPPDSPEFMNKLWIADRLFRIVDLDGEQKPPVQELPVDTNKNLEDTTQQMSQDKESKEKEKCEGDEKILEIVQLL